MSDETLVNYYEKVPKKFKEDERHYENEKSLQIKLPFRMVITGASGSGKTNALSNIITKINAFDKIMIWAKDTEEPLYASFIDDVRTYEKTHGASILTVSNTISDLPSVDSMNKDNNTLLIIDDMVTEKDKNLSKVSEYFIRGRKKNVSPIFLTQSYFDTPTLIRKQSSYFIFTKISGERDLNLILKDFRLGISEEQIMKLYTEATKGGFPNFFMIDLQTNDKDLRFRRNFKGIPIEDDVTSKKSDNNKPGASGSRFSHSRSGPTAEQKKRGPSSQAPIMVLHSDVGPLPVPKIIITNGKEDIYGKKRRKSSTIAESNPTMQEQTESDIHGHDSDTEMLDEYMETGNGLRKRRKRNLKRKHNVPKGKKWLDNELAQLIHCIR